MEGTMNPQSHLDAVPHRFPHREVVEGTKTRWPGRNAPSGEGGRAAAHPQRAGPKRLRPSTTARGRVSLFPFPVGPSGADDVPCHGGGDQRVPPPRLCDEGEHPSPLRTYQRGPSGPGRPAARSRSCTLFHARVHAALACPAPRASAWPPAGGERVRPNISAECMHGLLAKLARACARDAGGGGRNCGRDRSRSRNCGSDSAGPRSCREPGALSAAGRRVKGRCLRARAGGPGPRAHCMLDVAAPQPRVCA